MKRKATFLISLLLTTVLFAGPVDPERANEIATSFWNSTVKGEKIMRMNAAETPAMAKARGKEGAAKEAAPAYYMFTPEAGNGFVIVSGDDALTPIVGYSTTNSSLEMPPALQAMLDTYDEYINDIRSGLAEPMKTTESNKYTPVEPMLTTVWDQGAPYNNLCPSINSSRTPTGCTATAMAQIMNFHEWPEKPTQNIMWYNNITQTEERVDIINHVYNWDNMADNYVNYYGSTQDVAQLMVDVGKAAKSSYNLGGTSAAPFNAMNAMVNVFDYSPEAVYAQRREYTNDEYMTLIVKNLNARQPLLYVGYGQNYSSGHAFVCDGIDENGMLHINWGWGGAYDGYFDIATMAPEGTGIGGGEDRYNMGQGIIANIHPRRADETTAIGTPTLYSTYVLDPTTPSGDYRIVEESFVAFSNNTAKARMAWAFLNWSHTDVNMKMAISFEKEDLYEGFIFSDDFEVIKQNENTEGHYVVTLNISNNPNSNNYFEPGTYKVRVEHSNDGENFITSRGEENCLMLEITEEGCRLYKQKPEVVLTDFVFHTTPTTKGDRLAFDATFKNTNTTNAVAVIVPILNKEIGDNVYKSDTLDNAKVVIEVYDDQNIVATFDTSEMFPDDGKYHISFTMNAVGYYTGDTETINRATLIGIKGRSPEVNISPLPDGAVLSATAINATNIEWGAKTNIACTIKNIATTNDAFTGTIGLCIKEKNSGAMHVIATKDISSLAKDETFEFTHKNNDYFPTAAPGEYVVFISQRTGGAWEPIRQSAATCNMKIDPSSTVTLYATDKIEINGGKDVLQGSEFTVKAKITSKGGDFEGYVRADTPVGMTYYVRSGYIAVSLKEGESTEITLSCKSKANIPLGIRRLDIVFSNTSKKKLGDVSNNTVTFRNNGYFWTCDATAIETVEGGAPLNISGSNGSIIINGAAAGAVVKVYSIDGRSIYSGAATEIAVAKGMYIVVVETADGNSPATAKVFVK